MNLAACVAVVVVALVLWLQPFADQPPGSSPSRTAYSAVYALKHKNFGRFCSYLNDELRGKTSDCTLRNISGWAQFAMFFGVDMFGEASHVVAGSEKYVDENTVTYRIELSLPDSPFYLFTITRGENGLWRISDIEGVG